MKPNPYMLRRALFALLLITLFTSTAKAQLNPFWNTNGNAGTSGNFLGTTNNEPLIFKTNGLEALRIKPNGNIQVNAFQNQGKGLVWTNNNGVLNMTAFPNDTNQVFTGSGSFKSIATLSGWTRTGNVLYNSTGVNVGIGITNPQYPLEVQGSAFFHGTVYATGVVLVNKMLVDTLTATDMFSLNNHLHMSAGGLNQMYTSNGDLRFQSVAGYNYNTIFNAGTTGNVGIGTFNPSYKLDVVGAVRVTDKIYVNRLVPLPGDSMVHIGDSSITFNNITNVISATVSVNQYRGLGIGWGQTRGAGFQSLALGVNAQVSPTASNAMVIGSGVSFLFPLVNSTSKSLMIGFNSNLPTMFIAPASGINTIGKVGIGTTTPEALFQVGNSTKGITMDQSGTNTQGFMSTIGFNVSRDANTGFYTAHGDGTQNSGGAITLDNDGALRFYVFANTGGADQQTTPVHFENLAIMSLQNNRVQIGQRPLSPTSPFNDQNTKLTVDGRIMCQDLIVSDVDWQDEVFDSTYALMPMDSVAAYIATNGHLPGVAPEEQVEQDGMSVSETTAMQQQKIEELMLYILELNERMKAIEAENAKLKEQQPK